jgi:hypothetical protein
VSNVTQRNAVGVWGGTESLARQIVPRRWVKLWRLQRGLTWRPLTIVAISVLHCWTMAEASLGAAMGLEVVVGVRVNAVAGVV